MIDRPAVFKALRESPKLFKVLRINIETASGRILLENAP